MQSEKPRACFRRVHLQTEGPEPGASAGVFRPQEDSGRDRAWNYQAAGQAGPWFVGQQALSFLRGLLVGHPGPVAFSFGSWLDNCSPPERAQLSLLQEAFLD